MGEAAYTLAIQAFLSNRLGITTGELDVREGVDGVAQIITNVDENGDPTLDSAYLTIRDLSAETKAIALDLNAAFNDTLSTERLTITELPDGTSTVTTVLDEFFQPTDDSITFIVEHGQTMGEALDNAERQALLDYLNRAENDQAVFMQGADALWANVLASPDIPFVNIGGPFDEPYFIVLPNGPYDTSNVGYDSYLQNLAIYDQLMKTMAQSVIDRNGQMVLDAFPDLFTAEGELVDSFVQFAADNNLPIPPKVWLVDFSSIDPAAPLDQLQATVDDLKGVLGEYPAVYYSSLLEPEGGENISAVADALVGVNEELKNHVRSIFMAMVDLEGNEFLIRAEDLDKTNYCYKPNYGCGLPDDFEPLRPEDRAEWYNELAIALGEAVEEPAPGVEPAQFLTGAEATAQILTIVEDKARAEVSSMLPANMVEAAVASAIDLASQQLAILDEGELVVIATVLSADPTNIDKLQGLVEATDRASAVSAACGGTDPTCPVDAYRHVLWSYYLAVEFGPEFAQFVTDTYEDDTIRDTGNTEAEHQMDYANNAVGRTYAAMAPALTDDEILGLMKDDPNAILAA